MMSTTRLLSFFAMPISLAVAQTVPAELFSSSTLSKVLTLANTTATPSTWPEYTGADGSWELEAESDWTSGFFPSSLYLLHQRDLLCPSVRPLPVIHSSVRHSADYVSQSADGTDWLALARTWSSGLYAPSEAVLASWLHDVGFNSFPMLEELKLDGDNETAKATVLSNAAYLASRFSSVVGCTESWDRGSDNFEVVRIDLSSPAKSDGC
jgi:hypothetical protein